MRRFIDGGIAAYADLERRARTGLVRFVQCLLPRGTSPRHASVGFQVHEDNAAILFVELRAYRGTFEDVRRWLTTGAIGFSTFAGLQRWIQETLGAAFAPTSLDSQITLLDRTIKRLAREWELAVDDVSPGARLALLRVRHRTGISGQGEAAIRGQLEKAFAGARCAGIGTRIRLYGGPPFYCIPATISGEA